MNRRLGNAVATAAPLLALGLLTGCGGDEPDDEPDAAPSVAPPAATEPAPSTSAPEPAEPTEPPPTGGAGCLGVSVERLGEITDRAFDITGPRPGGVLAGEQCQSVGDVDEPLTVGWAVGEALLSFDETLETEAAGGLDTEPVALGGGFRAGVVSGEVAGVPLARVVAVRGEELVRVEVQLLGLDADESDLAVADLERIAVDVARECVAALPRG